MKKRVGILCIILALITVMSGFSVCAEQTEREVEITSVKVSEDGKKLVVNATVSDYYIKKLNGRLISLFEFSPSALQADIEGAVPVASAIPAPELTFEIDLESADPQRKYSKFALGYTKKKNHLIGKVAYLDDPEALAKAALVSDPPESTVGMVPLSGDVSERIGHAVIPVYVNELFATTPDGSVRYQYGENVYYIDNEVLTRLDKRVKEINAEKRAVYLQLLLTKPSDSTAELTEGLYSSFENGNYYAPNTADDRGVRLWSSLVEFLCNRYAVEDDNGRIDAFILGDNVNEKGNFVSSATDLDTFVYDLARTVRVTSTAIRSTCTGVGLYLDLDGRFSGSDENVYALRDIFAEVFSPKENKSYNSLSRVPFGILLDTSTENVKFWEDEGVTSDFSTERITPANIDFFEAYLRDNPTLLHNGRMRELIISYSVPGEDLRLGQAALLGAVYRAMSCKGVKAFIYGTPLDAQNATDSAVYSELCTAADSDINGVAARIKELLKRSEYESLAGTALSDVFVERDTLPLYTGDLPEDGASYIANFADGSMYSFTVSRDVNTYGMSKDSQGDLLRLTGHGSIVGASRAFEKGKDLFSENIMTVELKPLTNDASSYLTLTLNGTKGGVAVSLSSTVELRPGEWNTVAFDISGIDMLWNMSFEVESSEDGALTVFAHGISVFSEKMGIDDMAIRIAMIILVCVLIFFIILLIILLRMRAKRRAKAKKRTRYKFARRNTLVVENVKVNVEIPSKKEQKSESKEENKIPVMPKTETKTFVVPSKHTEPTVRKTMSLGIEPVSKDAKIEIDKTKGD